jgi:ABC-2 type transport system permease protein
MFSQIFTFELRYRFNRPATWIYFGVYLLVGFLSVATGWTPASEKVMHNAPWTMAEGNIFFSFTMILVCSAVMGVPLYRDIEYNTRNYLFAAPITKSGYFWGRFFGSFVYVLLIGTGFSCGSYIGSFIGVPFGWVPAERVGDYNLWNYFYPYFVFAIGNLILSSTIFFALVSFTRNVKVIYSASILLFIAYLLGNFLVRDIENHDLVKLLDPFAINTFSLENRFTTPYEKNNVLPVVSSVYLLNRLIWVGAAIFLILFTYYKFSFSKFLQPEITGNKKSKKEKEEAAPVLLPKIHQQFGGIYIRQIFWNLTKIEFLNVIRDNYFRAIMLGAMIFLVLDIWIGDTVFSVSNLPLTIFIMDYKGYDYNVFIFIILLFYTGEAVHREKATRYNILNDALPVSNSILFFSKLFGLIGIAAVMATIPIVVGMIIQMLKGFTQFNFPVYFIDSYLLTLPGFIQMLMLSFAVHILVNNKFAGHGVAMLIWIVMFLLRNFAEMNYNLFFYFFTPDFKWSDMNGLGHFAKPLFWFNFYWLFLGMLLATLAYLFFQRGVVGGFKERWRVARQRFEGVPKMLTPLFFIGWIGSGAYIYYNVSYLNNYYSASEERENQALYEKTLKKYENLPMPKATSLILTADIFPDERKMKIYGKMMVTNKSGEAIKTLHLMNQDDGLEYKMLFNGKSLPFSYPLKQPYSKFTFFKKGKKNVDYRIYKLPATMQPGDSALVEIYSVKSNKGFLNSGPSREVLHNGTFYSGGLPSFGYSAEAELESDEYRKKLGLKPKKDDLPQQNDPKGIRTMLFNDDADMLHFEATLSTTPDQIAIAPGYLQKTWEKDGRKYYRYVQDTPIDFFFNIVSAKYEVLKDAVKLPDGRNINIEVYYDKSHPFNLQRFNTAYKDGLAYFSETYGPFQFRQMRLMEFPRYASFAQSFANTVPYSENFGWVADFKSPDDFDYTYFVTAHELAHQWWGHQVTPNKTRGANLVSEALAEYTALILTEKKYGRDNMKRFLKDELDKYLSGRSNEAKKENTFINCNRPYQWYNKGSLIMYGLRDLMGDTAVNHALREFRDEYALRENPPFAGSNNLFAYLDKHTPDSLKYYLNDTWKKITLYENKFEKASSKAAGKDIYDVSLTFSSNKFYADSAGKEAAAPMSDYIDLGVFAAETTNKLGQKQTNPLFIKKYKLKPGTQTVTMRVKGKPLKAGIDPYNKLIDRIPDDNLGDVD